MTFMMITNLMAGIFVCRGHDGSDESHLLASWRELLVQLTKL